MASLGKAGAVGLVLMVRPNLVQASANLSTLCCMSSSVVEFKAQSSANRMSLIVLDLGSFSLGVF